MEWSDDAVVLSVRRHGETGALVSLLTRERGRVPGLVHGGVGRALRGVLQPGNCVRALWRGRLVEHLGSFRVELLRDHAGEVLDDPGKLAALASACALCELCLPERQPHGALHGALSAFLESLGSESWPSVYVHWELALLRDLGYGLDLGRCAVTGSTESLAFVSPKSGRAVSLSVGLPYGDKLLRLPRFLVEGGEGANGDLRDGLALCAFFLERHVLAPYRRSMPPARSRLVDRFQT